MTRLEVCCHDESSSLDRKPMNQPDEAVPLPAYLVSLPKAELHLHLEGTVDPETLAELSRRHPTPLPTTNNRYRNLEDSGRVFTEAEARALYQYEHFTGFLWAFKAVTERLRTAEDYELVTYRMMQKLQAQNVRHAEVYISAGVVQWRGQEFGPLFEGAERGRQRGEREFGISLYWILDAVRHFGVEEAQRVVEEAIRLRDRNVIGIGIGGDERRAGPEQFREVYEYAARHGLRLTVHAGETVGPESIWGALRELKADRIGHGLRAVEDPELVRYLADRQIPVEVCITSNLLTGCCATVEDHPVRRLFDAGVLVTLNTDDPDMFHTTLAHEYQIAQQVFGFSEAELRELAQELIPRVISAGGEQARDAGEVLTGVNMAKHIGIVACSAEGAALCYRTICTEAPALMGPHRHPEVSMHTHSLASTWTSSTGTIGRASPGSCCHRPTS